MSDKVTLGNLEFWVHPIGTNYKDEPGVYAFMLLESAGWAIKYIGEADSLKSRLSDDLKQHHRYNAAVTKHGSTHLATRIVTGDRQVRLDLETRLRGLYDPPCNRQ